MEEPATELPERAENAVKGDYGRVLVVGGSRTYTNTPAIVALGALRAGVDLVTVAAPGRSARIAPTFALNVVSEPLDGPHLAPDHVDTVLETAEDADCLAIGPGLGPAEETRDAVSAILDGYSGPAVVDADALHTAAKDPWVLGEETILTPHAAEFERIGGVQPGESLEERRKLVQEAAAELGCTVLLKGSTDIISDGTEVVVNATGTPYMTRGGTGDILTGIIAALRAQQVDPLPAAATAAEVNGIAGERALERSGPGFLLEEMAAAVSHVLGGGAQ